MSAPIVAIDARSVGQPHTGDATYWTGLIRGLQGLDSEISYLLYSNSPRPELIPDHPRFQWIELPTRRQRWWSLFRFPLAARRAGAKVLHVQYNLSPLVTAGGITTVHDMSFMRDPSWFRPQDRLVLQRFVPPSVRRASAVITVSEFSKREIAHFIPDAASKIRVTPNACGDGVRPVPRDEAKEHVRVSLGIAEPYVLSVGTRWPRKNTKLAVQACELLPDDVPHRLVLTGKSGWDDEEAGKRVVQTGYVYQEDLNALYSAADLCLAPALYEGFGITLLEAFRCGCPVLASPCEAHKEVAGDGAAFAPNWEPKPWAEAMRELLCDDARREQLREAGRRRELGYLWSDTAAKTEAIYREVLKLD